MKKMTIFMTVLVAAILFGVIGIRVSAPQTDITKESTKVGVVLNGTREDHSWNQSHADAFDSIEEELNLEIEYRENVPYGDQAAQTMEELIADGCKIIFAESVGFGNAVLTEEAAHPDVYFYHCSGTRCGDNYTAFFMRNYQSRYLAGIAAGYATQTGKIGYTAAYGYTEVIRGIDAFALGVRSVNPDAEVCVMYTESWDDYDRAYEVTKDLIENEDCDVIIHHTDTLAPLVAANDLGVKSIGNNYDNRVRYPDSLLCCLEMDWAPYYTAEIKSCLEGRFYGKYDWLGLEDGVCGITPLTLNMGTNKGRAEAAINLKRQEMLDGTWDVFFGPVYDSSGNLEIEDNEAASDYYLLNSLNWYVQGVSVYD